MSHQLFRNRLSIAGLIVFCLIAVGGIYKALRYTLPTKKVSMQANRQQTEGTPKNTRSSGKLSDPEHNLEGHNYQKAEIPEEKFDRIEHAAGELHTRMRRGELTPLKVSELYLQKEVLILVEGMDNLSAARYLRMQGGYDEYVREYAAKALNEDPDNFEALYILTKAQELETDREAGFRRLLEMDPNFVPVLSELGAMLARDSPEEAIEYLERANQLEPDNNLFHLGISYQRVGAYDKALVVLKRAAELNRAAMAQRHIKAIEAGTPVIPLLQREVEEPLQPGTEEQETGDLLPESEPPTPQESMEIETERSPTESPQTHPENTPREEDIRKFFEQMSDSEFAAFKQFVTKEFPELLPKDFSALSTDTNVKPSQGADQALARFSPERLNLAMEILNRYGPEEGIRRLEKDDPEIAKQIGRLINRKSPQQENDAPPE